MFGLFKKKKTVVLLAESDQGGFVVRFTPQEITEFEKYMLDNKIKLVVEKKVFAPEVFSLEKMNTIKCQDCAKNAQALAHYRKSSGAYIGYVPYCDKHIKKFEVKKDGQKNGNNIEPGSDTNKSKPNSSNRKTSRRR